MYEIKMHAYYFWNETAGLCNISTSKHTNALVAFT